MAKGAYNMKANIHPEMKQTTIKCACGASFTTRSTKENIEVEVCSECHPFYSGQQGNTKRTGNVEKFIRKYGIKDNEKAA